jgi:integrase
MRHLHASLLLAAGEDVATISERLGHASIAVTTNIYLHSMPGRQKQAATKFAALMGKTAERQQDTPIRA